MTVALSCKYEIDAFCRIVEGKGLLFEKVFVPPDTPDAPLSPAQQKVIPACSFMYAFIAEAQSLMQHMYLQGPTNCTMLQKSLLSDLKLHAIRLLSQLDLGSLDRTTQYIVNLVTLVHNNATCSGCGVEYLICRLGNNCVFPLFSVA